MHVLIKLRTERPRKLGTKTTLVDVGASVVASIVLGEGLSVVASVVDEEGASVVDEEGASVVDEEGASVLVACREHRFASQYGLLLGQRLQGVPCR